MTEPLTPEEERYLRETHEWCVSDGMNHEAHRWIATLDAERALHPVSDDTPERSRLRTKPWLVRLTCCGRADGVYAADSWDEARAFREGYTIGDTGHDRSAVIEDALAASGDAPREHEWIAAKGSVAPDDLQVCAHPGCKAARSLSALASESHPTKERTE